MEQKSFFETLQLKYATPIIAIITAFYSFFVNVSKDELDTETKKISNEKIISETKIKKQEFQNELRIAVYKEVKEAIEKDSNEKEIRLTQTIVNTFLEDDKDFRDKLMQLLIAETDSVKAKSLIKIQDAIEDIEKIPAKNAAGESFTIDVFYLEGSMETAKAKAQRIEAVLAIKYPNYKIRVRLLPKIINAKSGYQVDSNQIRFEKSGNEEKLATEIKAIVDTITIHKKRILSKESLIPHPTTNKTPNYISIFIRNN